MKPHSAAKCQCSSLMPPAVSRMLNGMSPTSVAGGDPAEGNWLASAGLRGPGSVTLAGLVALMAPCGGSSGLPKVAAWALAAVAIAPVAVATNTSRLDIIAHSFPRNLRFGSRTPRFAAVCHASTALHNRRRYGNNLPLDLDTLPH